MRRAVVWFVMAVLLCGAAIGVYGYKKWQALDNAGPLTADKIIFLKRGTGPSTIARQLQDDGVIENARLFVLAMRFKGIARKLKAGEYNIPAGTSANGVMELLVSGKTIVHKITIPEGLTSQNIRALLMADTILRGKLPDELQEGRYLPETYHFSRGERRADIVRRMRVAQSELLKKLWKTRNRKIPVNTPKEAIILASIVEKETGVSSERARVAAVFVNRLHKNMPLQTDPTVIYALAGGAGRLDRPLTRKDLKTDHPYNTYRNRGLPPGPIANPGAEAIKAVLNPAKTKELYFVADGSGGHAFAHTLAEHNRNVRRWRRIRDRQKK